MTDEQIRQEIRECLVNLFTEEILLSFWTHESCPPTKDLMSCLEHSGWDRTKMSLAEARKKIKHPQCMDCWEEWINQLIEAELVKLDELGCVIKGSSLGHSHPHLANYYEVIPLIESTGG